MQQILIATDGSEAAQEAVEVGVELAVEQHARVLFLHVQPTIDWIATIGGPYVPLPQEVPRPEEDDALRRAAEVANAHCVDARARAIAGDPATEIAAAADKIDADLVVVGSRGRGALLGSVLKTSKRPVLVVRATRTAVPV